MNKQQLITLLGSTCLGLSAYASTLHLPQINGTVSVNVPVHLNGASNADANKTIKLMKIKLNKKQKAAFAKRAKHQFRMNTFNRGERGELPASVNLTMNDVPVLDQGMHGSCVTFANAGAINAALGKGDYVSELCNLALGKHLEENGYIPSGWDGSWGPIVLDQIMAYGIVNKANENGCGGLSSYPKNDQWESGEAMSLIDYHAKSENISYDLAWAPIISTEEVFHDEYDPSHAVADVKRALHQGHRVTFGVLLDIYRGQAGAVGKYKSKWGFDTWIMTPGIEQDLEEGLVNAGHEILIYGYDDDAVVTDEDGNEQKGIFIIRNSWSTYAGNEGDYYMTYDYFKTMTMEAQKIYAEGSANND